MNKKVLLINQSCCGGAERVTLLYGKIFEKAGYDIDMVIHEIKMDKDNYPLRPFIPNHWHIKYMQGRTVFLFYYLTKYILKIRPGVVFASLPRFNIVVSALRMLKLIGCPVVIRNCNMPSKQNQSRNKGTWLFKFADGIISQTQDMKEEMVRYYGLDDKDITVLHNPIDKERILEGINEKDPLDHRYTNYVAVGKFQPQKDFETLLMAFANVVKVNPESRLYIVGQQQTEYKKKLDAIIDKNRIGPNVFFEGFQSNPYKYINYADCFVLSSIYEGLPNVMLEAIYLGVPVAATRCIPFIMQVIEDGTNGYTCPVKDPSGLSEIMTKAAEIKNLTKFNDITHSDSQIVDFIDSLIKS